MKISAFAAARHIVPILCGLLAASPKPASFLLAAAALLSAGIPRGLGLASSASQSGKAVDRASLFRSLGFAAATLVLGGVGFNLRSGASDFAAPTALLGLLVLGTSLLGLGAPSLTSMLVASAPTAEEQAILYPNGNTASEPLMLSAAKKLERDRVKERVDARGEAEAIGYVAGLIIESSAGLFAGMVFAILARASDAPSSWAWQGAGAFALAYSATGTAIARITSPDEGNPLTPLGGVLLVAFIVIFVAASNGWKVTLVGAPMVVLSMLLTIIRPSVRFRRACDIVLCLAAIGTGVGVLAS